VIWIGGERRFARLAPCLSPLPAGAVTQLNNRAECVAEQLRIWNFGENRSGSGNCADGSPPRQTDRFARPQAAQGFLENRDGDDRCRARGRAHASTGLGSVDKVALVAP
jgi:hypothetical protein